MRVRRNPAFDAQRKFELTDDDVQLWNRIRAGTTVDDLVLERGTLVDRHLAALHRLQELGAVFIEVGDPVEDDGIEIVDQVDIGRLTPAEARLLAEEVQLEDWEKRRIIAMLRTLKDGDAHELLGISPTATKRDIKRAYFELSKEYHPDRYFRRDLGSYGPLLATLFAALTDAMETLTQSSGGPGGPRRRISERWPFATKVKASCAAWNGARDFITRDVSEDGVFVCGFADAERGQRIDMTITLPNMGLLPLRGTVVRRGAQPGEPEGLGIRLDPLSDSERMRMELVLGAARKSAPVPADVVSMTKPPAPVPAPLVARGSGPIRRPSTTIGIDLGTTYTAVAAAVDGRVKVLPWPNGARCVPSVVGFPSRGRYVVGVPARDRLLYDPKHTIASAKRLLGRQVNDPAVERHLAQAAYDTTIGPDGSVVVDMWGERYAIAQICAFIMREAKDAAEQALGYPVEKVVLTVPVSFNERRVEMLRRAARIAQLDVVQVIDEPTAAALANRYQPEFGGVVGVYDFGGGTFDFSLIDASAGDFRVIETGGDDWLGGDDLDLAVANAVAEHFAARHGVELRNRAVEWQHLLFEVERAKRSLTSADSATITIPEALRTAEGAHDLQLRIQRAVAERLWQPAIERSLAVCTEALGRAGTRPRDLSAIYLSGGTSYVPAVRVALKEGFGVPVHLGVPPEYAAAVGAGLVGADIDQRTAFQFTAPIAV